jgi:hypothetical protein
MLGCVLTVGIDCFLKKNASQDAGRMHRNPLEMHCVNFHQPVAADAPRRPTRSEREVWPRLWVTVIFCSDRPTFRGSFKYVNCGWVRVSEFGFCWCPVRHLRRLPPFFEIRFWIPCSQLKFGCVYFAFRLLGVGLFCAFFMIQFFFPPILRRRCSLPWLSSAVAIYGAMRVHPCSSGYHLVIISSRLRPSVHDFSRHGHHDTKLKPVACPACLSAQLKRCKNVSDRRTKSRYSLQGRCRFFS